MSKNLQDILKSPDAQDYIIDELISHGFKRRGSEYVGQCPECGANEAYAKKDPNWALSGVFCPRRNNCGGMKLFKDHYPGIWDNLLARRGPKVETTDKHFKAKLFAKRRGIHDEALNMEFTFFEGKPALRFPFTNEKGEVNNVHRSCEDPWIKNGQKRKMLAESGKKIGDKLFHPVKPGYDPKPVDDYADSLFIVEGPTDACSLALAGFPTVGINGCNLSDDLIETIRNLSKTKKIIVALDPDQAGKKAAQNWQKKASEHDLELSFCFPPPGGDWNDYLNWQKLNKKLVDKAVFQGSLWACKNPKEVAWLYEKHLTELAEKKLTDDSEHPDTTRRCPLVFTWKGDTYGPIYRKEDGRYYLQSVKKLSVGYVEGRFKKHSERFDDSRNYQAIISYTGPTTKCLFDIQGGNVASTPAFKSFWFKNTGAIWKGKLEDAEYLIDNVVNTGSLPTVVEIEKLGYREDFKQIYCFENFAFDRKGNLHYTDKYGVIEKMGIALKGEDRKDDNSFFSKIAAPKPVAEYVDSIFECWGQNGIIHLAWYVASVFSHRIFPLDNSFPLLLATGLPGSGKSSITKSLNAAITFFMTEGVNPQSTKAAVNRTLASMHSLPTVFVEGDESESGGKANAALSTENLKRIYNRTADRQTGLKDNSFKTHKNPMTSCFAWVKNMFQIDNDAVFERIIHIQYNRDGLDSLAYGKHKKLIERVDGISQATGYGHTIFKNREKFEDGRLEQKINSRADQWIAEKKTTERMARNFSAILGVLEILSEDFGVSARYLDIAREYCEKVFSSDISSQTSYSETTYFLDYCAIVLKQVVPDSSTGGMMGSRRVIHGRELIGVYFQQAYSQVKLELRELPPVGLFRNQLKQHRAFVDIDHRTRSDRRRLMFFDPKLIGGDIEVTSNSKSTHGHSVASQGNGSVDEDGKVIHAPF